MNKIILSESDIHQIIKESLNRILSESNNKEVIEEDWKNWAMSGAIGAASLFGGNKAMAQSQQDTNNDSTKITQQYNNQLTVQDLIKLFPRAYKDRNASSDVWIKNQNKYVAKVLGKISLTGKIAASSGDNPWLAIVKKYAPQEYKKAHAEWLFSFDEDNIIK